MSNKKIMCPHPNQGDDGTVEDCLKKGHCGCTWQKVFPALRSILIEFQKDVTEGTIKVNREAVDKAIAAIDDLYYYRF